MTQIVSGYQVTLGAQTRAETQTRVQTQARMNDPARAGTQTRTDTQDHATSQAHVGTRASNGNKAIRENNASAHPRAHSAITLGLRRDRSGKHSKHARVHKSSQLNQPSSRLAQVSASDQIPYQTVHSIATNTASAEQYADSYNPYSTHSYPHFARDYPHSARGSPYSTAYSPYSAPPKPPQQLNAQLASDPNTHILVLWYIAQHIPYLRKWIIANSAADAQLLEYIAQCGGPGVQEAFEVLFASMEQ